MAARRTRGMFAQHGDAGQAVVRFAHVHVRHAAGTRARTDARFCSACGTPFGAEAPPREERKVVTCSSPTCRLHRARRAAGPRGRTGDSSSLHAPVRPSSSVSAAPSRSSSVTRSWRSSGRRSRRGRSERAVRAALAIRETLAEDGELRGPNRHHHGRGARRARRPSGGRARRSSPATSSTPRHVFSRRRRANGLLVDETTYVPPSGRSSTQRRARSKRRASRSRSRSGTPRALVPASGSSDSATRSLSDASGSSRSCEARGPGRGGARAAARDARGRAGHRQEPARLRALRDDPSRRTRARLVEKRPLAAVRRGRHLLGARRDDQGPGRHPRVRSADATAAKLRRPSSRCSRTRRGRMGRAPPAATGRARR